MMGTPQLLQRSFPSLDFLFRLFTCDAASVLYLAEEYVAFSSNDVHVFVHQVSRCCALRQSTLAQPNRGASSSQKECNKYNRYLSSHVPPVSTTCWSRR